MTQRAKITIAIVAVLVLVMVIVIVVLAFRPAATISVQIGPQAGQPRPAITVKGTGFPANREIYVGLAAPNVPPTAGTSFVMGTSDKDGKFSVTFPYPVESNWTELREVTVYAGTPGGEAVATTRLSLGGVAWQLTPMPSEVLPTPSPIPSVTATETSILPSPTNTPLPTATATPTPSRTPTQTPVPAPVISLQPASGRVGTAVVVTGRGWLPNETLSLGLLGSVTQSVWDVGTAKTDAQGNLTAGFVFPANWVGASGATVLARSGDGSRQALAVFQVSGQVSPTVPTPLVITGWLGQYYANTSLTGDPVLARNDNTIEFNWGAHSPAPGLIPDQRFSARWTRAMYFSAGNYRFWAEADDGVRLWLDDNPIMDEWHTASGAKYSGDVYNLGEGQHTVKVEYYQDTGNAQVRVWWQQILPPTSTATWPAPSATP
jgi:hypothetical protein